MNLKHYPHPIIAKEGWPFILLGLIVTSIILYYNVYLGLPFLLLTVFMIQFFRDPAREIPQQPNIIVSPADGKVIKVETAFDEYQQQDALKISVFMNVFNVHSNRSPVDGKVLSVNYKPGKYLNADFDKASEQNERNGIVAELANGTKVTFVQIAGLVARRILCYKVAGDEVKRGERYGFIRFGSRVDVYLPLDATPLVSIGQKVRATETVLATLKV